MSISYEHILPLRCKRCDRKMNHILINTDTTEKNEIEQTYECQECGEKKIIYKFSNPLVQRLMQYSLEKGLEELERIEPMEVEFKKKKHRFF